METERLIQVKNLTAGYGDRRVLDNISFDVRGGEIFMVVGGSGCGKTTLLSHLIGLKRPISGEVLIEGKDIAKASETEQNEILKQVGVLYQHGALFGSMNLLENVRLPLEELTQLPADAMNELAYHKLKLVGLGDFLDYMPEELSGGMQKRAALARALVLDPHILFLDEPSAGLDPITSAQLDDLILSLAKTLGVTFFIISHELSSIYKIGQRVMMLHQAKILAEGKPMEMRDHANSMVRQFFRGEA